MLVIKQDNKPQPAQDSMPRLRPHVGITSSGRGHLVTALAKPGTQSSDIDGLSPSPPPFPFTALGRVGKSLIRSKEVPADLPPCPTL